MTLKTYIYRIAMPSTGVSKTIISSTDEASVCEESKYYS